MPRESRFFGGKMLGRMKDIQSWGMYEIKSPPFFSGR